MRFVKSRKDNDYRYYRNPATVWLFEVDGQIEISAHFGLISEGHTEPDLGAAMKWARRWVTGQALEFIDELRGSENEVINPPKR